MLGAGIGLAISIPIFDAIKDTLAKILFMVAFATVVGTGQVLAARNTPGARKFTRLAVVVGVITLLIGIIAFLFAA
jgi:hypothetical protein